MKLGEDNSAILDPDLDVDAVICIEPSNVSCDLADEAIILNIQSGTYFGLNSVGARIWKAVAKPTSIRDICAVICNEYDIEPAQCEQDVKRLVHNMVKNGLVRLET